MYTIYLVADGPYLDDLLEGFATDEAGIRQIVANNYTKYSYIDTDQLDIEVDVEKGEVTVKEGCDTTFYIHAVQGISG